MRVARGIDLLHPADQHKHGYQHIRVWGINWRRWILGVTRAEGGPRLRHDPLDTQEAE